ncbi:dihydrolipoamide acetyltransferase family protein [Candidatus Leptofilum sp.]|uniref:dihydrolipoamide acetyltransferase family protein n=1 Tax=Candidatus Leptofilum sp. TaxID=3241576 RepID=UPI003B5B7FF5
MATPIIMPKFEMSQEEALVMAWLVAEGDFVEKGDPLMEVETDKVTMEVEAPEDGILRGVLVQDGDVVPVAETIAYIVPKGEEWSPPKVEPETAAAPAPAVETVSPPKATPIAQRIATANEIDINEVMPAANDQKIRRQEVEQFLQERQTAPARNGRHETEPSGKVRATPAARRVAKGRGLELAQISGSGPRGRVQANDVTSFKLPSSSAKPTPPIIEDVEQLPINRMRRTIAERLTQSYQAIPHITFTVTADMTAVLDLRQRLNEQAEKEGAARVSVTAVLAKVCAWALGRHPLVNASWHDDSIQLHRQANIGIAVALDDGLIVPVVQNVAALGLLDIANQMRTLTARARENRLQPQDVQGGTFTISNLGMLGIDHFTAIINPPQSAILAVGRTVKQPLVVETEAGDELVIRPLLKMTLSVDHRTVDGAVAARFLQDLIAGLEQPDRLLW